MFLLVQKILPRHGLSRLLGILAHWRCAAFKNCAIRCFMKYFKVDLTESLITDIEQFPAFNDFFVRQLKPNARPLPQEMAAIACPADGNISELGKIDAQRLLQAKGKYYSLLDLLGGNHEMAQRFDNGEFLTVYLAPKDYHRVHMPVTGILRQMIHIPGELFSVNAKSVNGIPQLFARNERVICLFETAVGQMAVIFVGAMLIGSVVTTWHGQVMPAHGTPLNKRYDNPNLIFQRGAELGYFQWGSTVIVLFESKRAEWRAELVSGDAVRMGQSIGNLCVDEVLLR